MPSLRKLAAVDIAFLGYRLIVAEYAFAVVFSLGLGVLSLVRGQAVWQMVLGAYLIFLAINYVPMLAWALRIGGREGARLELGDELANQPAAMARYRRQSLLLLVPLGPVVALLI